MLEDGGGDGEEDVQQHADEPLLSSLLETNRVFNSSPRDVIGKTFSSTSEGHVDVREMGKKEEKTKRGGVGVGVGVGSGVGVGVGDVVGGGGGVGEGVGVGEG